MCVLYRVWWDEWDPWQEACLTLVWPAGNGSLNHTVVKAGYNTLCRRLSCDGPETEITWSEPQLLACGGGGDVSQLAWVNSLVGLGLHGNSSMSQLFRQLTFSFRGEIMALSAIQSELLTFEPDLETWAYFGFKHETGCKLAKCSRNRYGVRMMLRWDWAVPHIMEELAEVRCCLAVW